MLLLCAVPAAAQDLRSRAQAAMKTPDAYVTGVYEIPAPPALTDALLQRPTLLARLWEVWGLFPRYKVAVKGNAIHVDDPTGISGDLYLAEQTPGRRVYFGDGYVNHTLVPSFRGELVLVLTTTPNGAGTRATVEVFVRASSRVLGLLGRTLFPLVRSRAENRVNSNMKDVSTLVAEVKADPSAAAARIGKPHSDALLSLLAPSAPAEAARVKHRAGTR
jgi:hypothetical protein